MSSTVTSVFTFKVESTFDEWAGEFNIQPLYRGCSDEDPQKIIVIHQHPEGNIEKFIEANGDWMASHRVDLSTMEKSAWTWTDNSSVQFKAQWRSLLGLGPTTEVFSVKLLNKIWALYLCNSHISYSRVLFFPVIFIHL